MLLLIAIGISIIYALLRPFAVGLTDTSLWVAKIIQFPVSYSETKSSKQFLRIGQAAVIGGWLSNVSFISSLLIYAAIILGFIYSWWGGIVAFLTISILGSITKLFMVRPVSYYLTLLYSDMTRRKLNYKKKNDDERYEAAVSMNQDLENIMMIYEDSSVKPPSANQLKSISYGDLYALLNREPESNGGDKYLTTGINKSMSGDPKGAIKEFNKSIENNGNKPDAFSYRAMAKLMLNNISSAMEDHNHAIQLNPNNSNAYYMRGLGKASLKDHIGAISDYSKAIELDPKNSDAFESKAGSEAALGNYESAVKDLDSVIDLKPRNADAHLHRGMAKFFMNDKISACTDWSKAGELGSSEAYELIRTNCS